MRDPMWEMRDQAARANTTKGRHPPHSHRPASEQRGRRPHLVATPRPPSGVPVVDATSLNETNQIEVDLVPRIAKADFEDRLAVAIAAT